MKWTGLNELRRQYINFFETKQHLALDSFPLVPKNDPSLLLINSGMAPMKKWFLAQETPPAPRVTTCQICIHTPDIERGGITARHGTFFEMLGNFSFQDYFKNDVIPWAWEFLTSEEWMAIPKELLYISVYEEDDEAYDIWTQKVGIAHEHMVRFGKADNFWEHGAGPCGPCSELYFDRGPEHGCGSPDCKVGCECDRYMEIWNLVFTQFDSDGKGTYNLLEKPNIDTGMGLERLACVLQGVGNLFEVDTVQAVLKEVEKLSGKTYKADEKIDISIRVITDHIRSCSFMVSDGVLPSNEGRGYVLRRLLRRAARHGRMIGISNPFLEELVEIVICSSEEAYPELREHASYIKKVIGTEEERFYRTIDSGMNKLANMLDELKANGKKELSGEDVFKLNDTFGFPMDLTKEIAAEEGISIDEKGFRAAMQEQKDRARKERLAKDISGWSADLFGELTAEPTVFTGYEKMQETGVVIALAEDDTLTEAVTTDDGAKQAVYVILDKTPFYAEMGGQVADCGFITSDEATLRVEAVKKTPRGYYVHTCVLENGIVKVGDVMTASLDKEYRMAIARNHTATHLLQAALREVLGEHVHQAGSYQDASVTRFDFTHFSAVTGEEIAKVEAIVNDKILAATPVDVKNVSIEEAKEMGAMALFGEKYGSEVRVVDVDKWSTEFCGGTHVTNTAQVGAFKIISEASVAAGTRRIEAVTGKNLLALMTSQEGALKATASILKCTSVHEVPQRTQNLVNEYKNLTRELDELKAKIARNRVDGIFNNAKVVDGVQIMAAYFAGATSDALRAMCDRVQENKESAVAVIVGSDNDKISMAVCVTKAVRERGLKAGVLVKEISAIAGGNGGGKPDFAMAGLKDQTKIDEAIAAVPEIVAKHLGV